MSLSYRPEVDGLRTIAVVSVILFHLGATSAYFPGGFVGVDVFFVISGFLITSILQRDLERGTLSLRKFWWRRIRRLYPALLTVVIAVLVAGSFLFMNSLRDNLVWQSLAALFSFQNIHLWQATDSYWNNNSELVSLLHTWSLSLEEQFYILFPFFLIIIHKFFRKHVLLILSATAVASFAVCLWGTAHHQEAAFYLLPARMWELMIGGILGVYRLHRPEKNYSGPLASSLSVVGLGLIVLTVLTMSGETGFPGYKALLPCVGAALVLHFGQSKGPGYRFLTLPPIVYTGKISYSLYLWHWPIIFFANGFFFNVGPVEQLILTVILSILSYHVIEQPFRRGFPRFRLCMAGIGTTVAAAFALLFFTPGPAAYIPADKELYFDDSKYDVGGREFNALWKMRVNRTPPHFGRKEGPVDICLLGSSHGLFVGHSFADYAEDHHLSMVNMSARALGFGDPVYTLDYEADVSNLRLELIEKLRPRVTVMLGRWDDEFYGYRQGGETSRQQAFLQRLRRVAASSDQVIIVLQVPILKTPPMWESDIRHYFVGTLVSGEPFQFTSDPHVNESNQKLVKALDSAHIPNVATIDPTEVFVDRETGELDLVQGGSLLYFDDDHLNVTGGGILFDSTIEPALDQVFEARQHVAAREEGKRAAENAVN
ncbi:MAG: acetyltransferase [Puniceicoccaceae bacterium 5H]|nr:MAG: acetyltransferase [Puniceicoccaceae bacterium 5H]